MLNFTENVNSQLADIATLLKTDCFVSTALGHWGGTAVSSGVINSAAGTAKHPGVAEYASHNSNADSGYKIIMANVALLLAGGEKTTFIFKTAPTIIGVTRRMGFHDATSVTAPTDGVYVKQSIDGGDNKCYLTGHTVSNNTLATTATKIELAADTWYRIVIEINSDGTTATFTLYQDDSTTVLWTDTLTANGSTIILPTGTGRNVGHGDICTLASPSGAITIGSIDYIDVILPNARRVV
jgi:hypothetical protein